MRPPYHEICSHAGPSYHILRNAQVEEVAEVGHSASSLCEGSEPLQGGAILEQPLLNGDQHGEDDEGLRSNAI